MFVSLRQWLAQKNSTYLPSGSIRARYVSGVMWSTLGSVISQGLVLISSVLVARMLGQESYGILGIVNSTVIMLGTFAGIGIGMTATKHVAEFRTVDTERTGRILGLSLAGTAISSAVISLLLVLGAEQLATYALGSPELASPLRLGAVSLFFTALNGTQIGGLAGFEAFRTISRINIWRGVLSFPLIVFGTWLWGVSGSILATGFVALMVWLLSQHELRQVCREFSIRIRYQGSKKEMDILWRFSVPAFLASILVGPVMWIGNAILVNSPNGLAQMGVFNAANQWRTAILFLPIMLASVGLPMLTDLYGQSEDSYRRLFWGNLAITVLAAMIIAVPIIFASHWIMSAYGSEFADGSLALSVMAAASIMMAAAWVVGNAVASIGAMWWGVALNLLWALVFLTSSYVLVGMLHFGAVGLSAAYFTSYAVHTGNQILYLQRGTRIIFTKRLA